MNIHEISGAAPALLDKPALVLLGHISAGIEMLRADEGFEAYKHFNCTPNLTDLPKVEVYGGRSFLLRRLLSEEDVVVAASTVALNSRAHDYGGIEMGGWYLENWAEDFDDSGKFSPPLVNQFNQEAGIVAAEEWIHMLQYVVGRPLAGQEDYEVDAAAFLRNQGIDLSDDFLTRYPERAIWHLAQHPEDSERISEFQTAYQRSVRPFGTN